MKDNLNGWREENFGKFAGGCEYDSIVEAVEELKYFRTKMLVELKSIDAEIVEKPKAVAQEKLIRREKLIKAISKIEDELGIKSKAEGRDL